MRRINVWILALAILTPSLAVGQAAAGASAAAAINAQKAREKKAYEKGTLTIRNVTSQKHIGSLEQGIRMENETVYQIGPAVLYVVTGSDLDKFLKAKLGRQVSVSIQ